MLLGALLLLGAAALAFWQFSLRSDLAPEGQVVAIVDDYEITATDLATEARALGTPIQTESARRAVLESIVDRQVLAGAAVEQALDRSPHFQAERRRTEHVLLARLALEGMAQAVRQPTDEEVRQFVARNGTMFDERQNLALDQIRFFPSTALSSREIAALDTMEESESVLRSKGIRFERGSMMLDTASLQANAARQIVRLPTGDLFFIAENGMGVLMRIVSRESAPVPESQRMAIAQRLLREQMVAETLRRRVEARRSEANIRYQEGYGPAD